MSKVFRINTSNIDGVGSEQNASNNVLAKGEAGFYDDNFGKLELVLGDGIRTHLKNKILGKGVFYGGNADSGDGYGFDTIKLIPDAALHFNTGGYGNDQYIIIDPTYPNHIHIRAGGVQDNSNAQLYLGGETSHFSVGSGTTPTLYIKSNDNQWTYGTDGNLTLPAGGDILDSNGTSVLGGGSSTGNTVFYGNGIGNSDGVNVNDMTIAPNWDGQFTGNVYVTLPSNTNASNPVEIVNNNTGGVKIITQNNATWAFGYDSQLTFPDSTVQTTAYPGITNTHDGSATMAVGIHTAIKEHLSVRLTNNNNTIDIEINYQNPDTTVLVSAYRTCPSNVNLYAGRASKVPNNTDWDNFGNLPGEGDSLSFIFTDHSFYKIYRVTIIADIMPGVGAAGEAFCTIEELK